MPPLIAMLSQGDMQLKEMAAFALGRLAQNADNQAGVVEVRFFGQTSFMMHPWDWSPICESARQPVGRQDVEDLSRCCLSCAYCCRQAAL